MARLNDLARACLRGIKGPARPLVSRFRNVLSQPVLALLQEVQHQLTSLSGRVDLLLQRSDAVGLGERVLARHPLAAFMYLDAREMVVTPQVIRGLYEPGITTALQRLVKPGQVVVEAGANQGFHTLTLGLLVGARGKVLSFEADARAFRILTGNVRSSGLDMVVEPFHRAAHRINGPVTFYQSDDTPAGSNLFDFESHQQAGDAIHFGSCKATTLEAVRIGDVLRERNLHPDFVRIDVEGAEALVLDGMWDHLEQRPHLKVLFEFFPYLIEKSGFWKPGEFLDRLTGIGMRFWRVEKDGTLVPTTTPEMLESDSRLWEDYLAARDLE